MDLVIIVDASTSVGAENFQKQMDFVKQIISNSDVNSGNVRIGVVVYSTEVHIEIQLNAFKAIDDINAAVDGIVYR